MSYGILGKFKMALASLAFAVFGVSAANAQDPLIDWRANAPSVPVSGYIPSYFVNNGNASLVASQIQALPSSQKAVVKITEPLSSGNITTLFGGTKKIDYAFYDIEGAGALATAQAQANSVRTISSSTYVSNYRLFPGSGDNSGVGAGSSLADYLSGGALGVNMASEDLYPGSGSYKNPAATGGTSTSPNIRSSLFTLPIKRATYSTANMPLLNQHIPYVTRFNNYGNTALDTDGNSSNGFQFTQNAANPANGQLIGRGDFKALVAHYRMRGINGYQLLDGGVQGYTAAEFAQDAKDGWSLAAMDNIFKNGGARLATLDTVVRIDGGASQDFETAGVVYSGVYSLSQNKLALLVSNLDDLAHSVAIPSKIGGKNVAGSFSVDAGTHRLLQFTASGTQWVLSSNSVIWNSASETDRNGVGVPEPVAMGTLSIFAGLLLCRRTRRQ